MIDLIVEMLKKMDERKIRLIYFFCKGLVREADKLPEPATK